MDDLHIAQSTRTLGELYAEHRGKVSDKWSLYLSEYENLLRSYRNRPINLLEIGIQNGGSLEIWSKFFESAGHIVGCDIDPACAQLRYDDPRVRVVVADASGDDAERQILEHCATFNVIVDDGSHESGDIVRCFGRYFPYLEEGGLYLIEDLHCSYWENFTGGLFRPDSAISFFKMLVDIVNHEHWGIDSSRVELLESFSQRYGVGFDEGLLRSIHSIEFVNSLCVVRKHAAAQNELGVRKVVGAEAEVAPGLHQLNGSLNQTPDQRASPWSTGDRRGTAALHQPALILLAAALAQRLAQGDPTGTPDEDRSVDGAEPMAADQQQSEALAEAHRREIEWRDEAIRSRDRLVAAKDDLIRLLNDRIRARDAIIEQRDVLLRLRDEQILAKNAAGGLLEAELQHKDRALEQLKAEKFRLEDRVVRISAAHQDELARVRALFLNSTSWRISAPVRGLVTLGRRLRGRAAAEPESAPAAILPAVPAAEPAAASAPPPQSVIAPAPMAADLKSSFRRLLQLRLNAMLAASGTLQLPRSAQPDLTIVLVLYNQAELTLWCLESIAQALHHSPLGVRVVIVDNASTDSTAELLARIEGADIVRSPYNMHFLRGVNAAARLAEGRHILLLNNDVQLLSGALEAAVRTLDEDPGVGAVGGRIILPDGTLQEAGSIIWNDGTCSGFGRGDDPEAPEFMYRRDVDYCSGAFLLTPRATFERLGGFDERYVPAYYEETDYCVRLWQAGLRVVYDPDVVLVHFEFGSATSSQDAIALQQRNRAFFCDAHAAWLRDKYPHSPANLFVARTVRASAKRVLVIEDRVPKVELGSGYPRANSLLRELVATGAEVTLFPMFRHPESWAEVRKALGPRVEVMIAAEGSQLRAYLEARRGCYDAILVCRPHNMRMFEAAIGTDHSLIGHARVIYDAEAIFARRSILFHAADGAAVDPEEERRLTAEEVSLTRLADAVISVSPGEQRVFANYGVRNIHLLAHMLSETPIATGFEERRDIVFVGALHDDNSPNADAVRWFGEAILPELRSRLGAAACLKVIGLNNAPSLAALDPSGVVFTGQVDDLNAALSGARLMVVPTRFAAGVPHKVHQAAALGIPMVVTGLIAEQVGWTAGEDYLVASDAAGFAASCAELYRNRDDWERIRSNALQRCRAECSPEAFRKTVREILDTVPLAHRMPTEDVPEAATQVETAEPATAGRHVGRPAEADYSLAVPFGYYPEPQARPERLAVVAHLFHADVAPELRYYLQNLASADLFVSTDTEEKRSAIAAVLGSWEKGEVELRVLPNRGRDIAPKLVGFRDVYDRYDYVLHLHSKKSHHATFLEPWRSFLYENLLGSPLLVASVFEAFARLPDLGIVFPQHFEPVRRWLDWTDNFEIARLLAKRMGIALRPERALDFPSGSMFWARSAALRPLLDLGLTFDDFPEEIGQTDRTPAHAIERLYLYACERAGYRWLKIARPELYFEMDTIVAVDSPEALTAFVAQHGVMLSGTDPLAVRAEPAPLLTATPPGLARALAAREF